MKFIQKPIDHAAQHALRKALGRGIDRRDPSKMNRYFFIILDDFELRMVHANSLSSQARLSKHDDALTGGDHLLHVMQIEPSTHERLAQCICLRFLQRGLKNFFPSTKTAQRSFDHFAAKTNRNVAFLARKLRELRAILMAPGEMSYQVLNRLDTKAA